MFLTSAIFFDNKLLKHYFINYNPCYTQTGNSWMDFKKGQRWRFYQNVNAESISKWYTDKKYTIQICYKSWLRTAWQHQIINTRKEQLKEFSHKEITTE